MIKRYTANLTFQKVMMHGGFAVGLLGFLFTPFLKAHPMEAAFGGYMLGLTLSHFANKVHRQNEAVETQKHEANLRQQAAVAALKPQ